MELQELISLYGEELVLKQLESEVNYKRKAEEQFLQKFNETVQEKKEEVAIGVKLAEYGVMPVIENIRAFFVAKTTKKPGTKPGYYGFLMHLQELYEGREEDLYTLLAHSALSTLITCVMGDENVLSNITKIMIREIEFEIRIDTFCRSNESLEWLINRGLNERGGQKYKEYYVNAWMRYKNFSYREWDRTWKKDEHLHFGIEILHLAIDGSGYFTEEHSIHEEKGGDGLLEVHANEWFLEVWNKNRDLMMENAVWYRPTIIPPNPWKNFYEGGYWGRLKGLNTLLKIKDRFQDNALVKRYIEALDKDIDLSHLLTVVNALQATPWRINKQVYEVMEKIREIGGGVGKIPPMEPLPKVPKPDFSVNDNTTEKEYKETEKRKQEYKEKAAQREKDERTRKSRALRTLNLLGIAREFLIFDKIYFPFNFDSRSRVYPIPTILNPQGDDVSKALLIFADAPPCNDTEDIEWLMVHGANLAGVDKVSFNERKQWIIDNEQYILQAAADPIGTLDFWKALDKPFQFISFCFEWARWKEYEKQHGTPKGFITGIPVAFDGSCSGLQHFSAALRDEIGGKAVNLMPADSPQDLYGVVAKHVNERLQHDAMQGTPDEQQIDAEGKEYTKYGTKTLAQQWLMYGVTRKVTKRCVMTVSYGSSQYGFGNQILDDTVKPAIRDKKGDMFVRPSAAAQYLAKLIWEDVQKVAVKAMEIMAWLQEVARIVASKGHVITWITPANFYVQQAYFKVTYEGVKFRMGKGYRRIYKAKVSPNLDKGKQFRRIAPNFIHSMDAAHMQLTVIQALKEGITNFAMIHDSFGAPVAQAKDMFRIVRETFVKMYTEHDIFEEFEKCMKIYINENKGERFPPRPTKGTLDITSVLNSLYAFS